MLILLEIELQEPPPMLESRFLLRAELQEPPPTLEMLEIELQ
jgi:hypothetical protein